MKNSKKILAVALVTVMSGTMLISCGKPKTSPEDTAKIYLDVVLKNDKTNMDKIGMTEDDYNTHANKEKDLLMGEFETSSANSNILTDEIKTNLENNISTGMSKLDYEVTPVSTDKDTAKVNVKINCFKFSKLVANEQQKITEEVTANPSMTENEIIQESLKIAGEEIAAGPEKDDTTTVEVNLTKKNNIWVPDDNFENDISKVAISMN
ncbi:DUF5105 domain-containing protein [Clostridium saccharobutylicum]|nr:DUF5105 domain-containing protein [Clostridium saccharobutylicum]AQR91990.1 hypothetical protein CLOSC_37180 [Clostridium saccharobutylicum]AQS01892.1 hypothetical protein CSACC_37230 [Clostridium saccharobutylicum]AQS15875.1 hypothetical protein CLOSACC_37230 [Clostridium saccharobutylicum]MBA2903481.1 hypothetical protein [Clostridium saccharobutylicum]MBA8788320.1 hypothetical protein [Clostridium saccharobutylicum]